MWGIYGRGYHKSCTIYIVNTHQCSVPPRDKASCSSSPLLLLSAMDEFFAICLGGKEEANAAMDKIGTLAGTGVTRMWHFSAEDGQAHTVVVRHDHMFGRRIVELDGAVVHSSTGEMDCSIYYEVCGKPGKVTITSRVDGVTVLFYYENEYDGVEVPCTMHDVDGAGSMSQYQISIPGHKLMRGTVYYKIVSKLRPPPPRVTTGWGGEEDGGAGGSSALRSSGEDGGSSAVDATPRSHAVYRKFGEFQALHAEVRATFVGAHESMKERVPSLPAAYWKLLVDHLDPLFIEERRVALARYLQHLVGLSRTASNADIRSFLRITEGGRGGSGNNAIRGGGGGRHRPGQKLRKGERVVMHGASSRRGVPTTAVNALVTMSSSGGAKARAVARQRAADPYAVDDAESGFLGEETRAALAVEEEFEEPPPLRLSLALPTSPTPPLSSSSPPTQQRSSSRSRSAQPFPSVIGARTRSLQAEAEAEEEEEEEDAGGGFSISLM